MKNHKLLYLVLFLSVSFSSFAQKADSISIKLTGRIPGIWQIQSTSRAGRDRSANAQTQNIKFTLDGKYIWKSGKTTLDSGTYNTNEPQSEIFLQSFRNKDVLQEWVVNLKTNNEMSMTAKKGSKGDGTKYELVRVKDGR